MNKDSKLIFEAYLTKKPVLNEAPIYGPGDLDYTSDIESAPGGGYGVGTAAAKEGKTKTEIANRILNAVKTKLFKPAAHTIDGKEYQLYYPGSKMKFRTELENLIKNELKIGGTAAKYTARVIDNLLNVLRVDVEGGAAASPVQVKKAIDTGVQDKPITGDGSAQPAAPQATANAFVKNPMVRFIKEFMPIFVELPDEITISGKKDFYESDELQNEVKEAITRAYDETKAKDKELINDFIDSLKHKNSYTPQSEAKQQEGEGTGEEPTIDEYPEGDDVYTAAKQEFGLRQAPVDKGNFSYGD
jgi:hypothetical protein